MAEHKHAEVLRAIADGKPVQWQSLADGGWIDPLGSMNPLIDIHLNWRVKPEPKPDVVRWLCRFDDGKWAEYTHRQCGECFPQIKAVTDGETGKLKSVEIVE